MGCLGSKDQESFIEACRCGSVDILTELIGDLANLRLRQRTKYDVNSGLLLAVQNNHEAVVWSVGPPRDCSIDWLLQAASKELWQTAPQQPIATCPYVAELHSISQQSQRYRWLWYNSAIV